MSRIFAASLILLLSACATLPRTFEDKLQARYLYRPALRMNADLGLPKTATKLENGGSSYEWSLAEGKVPGSQEACRVLAIASVSDVVQTVSVDKTASASPTYCDEYVTLR